MTGRDGPAREAESDPLVDIDLLSEVVRAMVDIPEAVHIQEKQTGPNEFTLWIDVAPIDRGKIIGKAGRNITSLRHIFCSIGALEGKKLLVMVAEPGKNFTHPPRSEFRTKKPEYPEVTRIHRKSGNSNADGGNLDQLVEKTNGKE